MEINKKLNPSIHDGYLSEQKNVMGIPFKWHNDTINIWTHLLAVPYFFYLAYYLPPTINFYYYHLFLLFFIIFSIFLNISSSI